MNSKLLASALTILLGVSLAKPAPGNATESSATKIANVRTCSVPFKPNRISTKRTIWWSVTLERKKVTPEIYTDCFEPVLKDKWVILEVKDIEFENHKPASIYYVSDDHSLQANASAETKNDPTRVVYKSYWRKFKDKKVLSKGNLHLDEGRKTISGHHHIVHLDLNDNECVSAEYTLKGTRLDKPFEE